jgi:pimeloyl-ACP methyl ester carboxylesterase
MKSTVNSVTSKDGTRIGFDRLGQGPPVVLVTGGSVDRQSNAGLAQQLAKDFTVFNYDRRGRGDSGDTPPYAIEREIEDIEAVIDAAGGSAFLYGTSSGAALAFEAAGRLGPKVKKLAMWEPPYIPEGERRPPGDTVQRFERLVAEGRRGDAAEFFMTAVVGMPAEFAAFAKTQPWWAAQEALAHTLAYDARIMGDYLPPIDRARTLQTPAIVLVGGASFPAIREGGTLFAKALPNAQTKTLEGQEHNVAPEAIAPVLKEFFRGASA